MEYKKLGWCFLVLFLSGCASKSEPPRKTLEDFLIDDYQKAELAGMREKEPAWIKSKPLVRKLSSEEVDEEFLHPRDVPKKKMDFWIHYFSQRDKDRFERYLKNGARYKDIVLNVLKEHGLPSELFYLGLIESGYYTKARSRAAATGPWQFMRGTGKGYGLRVERGIDERVNIFKATHAAAKYLTDLYNIFGSWELALCAYNAGENKVIRKIRKHNTRDFKKLVARRALPRETINYIPKLLAAITVARNPKKYGINLPNITPINYSSFDEVKITRPISLKKLARELSIPKSDLLKWNQDLYHDRQTASRRRPLRLMVPTHIGQRLVANTSLVQKAAVKRSTVRRGDQKVHVVRSGENLSLIARKYGLSLRGLLRLNNLRLSSTLRVGQKISLRPSQITATVARTHTPSKTQAMVYRVRRGDFLSKIASRYRLSLSRLKSFNGLRGNTIKVGQKLKIPVKPYKVRRGDSLIRIARRFGVGLNTLISYNALKKRVIFPNQKLLIPIF